MKYKDKNGTKIKLGDILMMAEDNTFFSKKGDVVEVAQTKRYGRWFFVHRNCC